MGLVPKLEASREVFTATPCFQCAFIINLQSGSHEVTAEILDVELLEELITTAAGDVTLGCVNHQSDCFTGWNGNIHRLREIV